MAIDVLVIDDEADIRDLVSDILKEQGFNSRGAANSTEAFKLIQEKIPAAIILDIWLQDSELDGLGILSIIKKRYPLMPVIIISGHGTIETAVNSIKMGAYDYLEKPFSPDKLIILLKRACETTKLKRENIDLKSKVIDKTELIGSSNLTNKLKNELDKIAQTASRVMIQGGVGSGKELAARLIHKNSKRANNAFVVLSPVGMNPERMQQELFGTGGNLQENIKRYSVLEIANNGTLYIDEITAIPLTLQTKLLKFLQDQQFVNNAGQKIKLDIRFITATIKDIETEVSNGNLLRDLYNRLNITTLKIPSLQQRKDDIPELIKYFTKQLAKFSGLRERVFSDEAIAALQLYHWPGNIRQLRNVVEWTLIMNPVASNEPDVIKSNMIPPEILKNGNIKRTDQDVDYIAMSLRDARENFEKWYLHKQLERFGGNISKTAYFIGMERSALHRKMKYLGLNIIGKRYYCEVTSGELAESLE